MRKKVLSKRLIINKETVSNLSATEMKSMQGGTDTSLAFSCPWYYTICLLTACNPTTLHPPK